MVVYLSGCLRLFVIILETTTVITRAFDRLYDKKMIDKRRIQNKNTNIFLLTGKALQKYGIQGLPHEADPISRVTDITKK